MLPPPLPTQAFPVAGPSGQTSQALNRYQELQHSSSTFTSGPGPSIYLPGFRPTPYYLAPPAKNHMPVQEGYQNSHHLLAHDHARRASVAYSIHKGEIVNVKAILAHFPRGTTKPMMIGVGLNFCHLHFHLVLINKISGCMGDCAKHSCSYWG